MAKKKRPSQKSASSTSNNFQLPPGMSFHKEQIGGHWAYTFRHTRLGFLGRLVLHDRGGQCQVSSEVAGEPDDPTTAQRLAVLQPLTMSLLQRLQAQTGGPVDITGIAPPPPTTAGGEWVESKMRQCERCDAGVALLIFAVRAKDRGGLEDYARLMYQDVVRKNLPTYVIGPALGDGPLMERPADILKIWPEREPIRRLRPDEFNPIIAALAHAHCS